MFDLDARARDAARGTPPPTSIRHLLFKYGHAFEPRLWRFGARLDETEYV